MLMALLDSSDWLSDRGDDSIFWIEGELCREGETLDEELWNRFFHQNTRYPRSLKAVPFLSETLPRVSPLNQPFLINYLVQLALGASHWHLAYGFRPVRTRGAYMDETLGVELHAAVQRHAVPHFFDLAHSAKRDSVRTAALWALAWFPDCHAEALPFLTEVARSDSSNDVRDAARFALGMLKKATSQPAGLADDDWGQPDPDIEQLHNDLMQSFFSFDPYETE